MKRLHPVGVLRRRAFLSCIGGGLFLAGLPLRWAGAAQSIRYFTPTGAGGNSGADWQNAMRISALPRSLASAGPGDLFAIAVSEAAETPIPIDKGQISLKSSGNSESPIVLDAGGAEPPQPGRALFESSKPWSIEAIAGRKNASAYIALVKGASHIVVKGFDIRGTSPDGFVKFRGGKDGATEFRDVRFADLDARDVGRIIETDRQAFLKDIVVENCRAAGIVRGFARFHNIANSSFRNLDLDADNFDGGGKNVCQLISIQNGENLLFEDVTLKNARNEKWKEDGKPGYFQGDGIVCERGTRNVTIRRCHGSGMGDAAFDLKTTDVTMEECTSDACKFGARFWTESENVARRCAFRNPVAQGNTEGACIQASGRLVVVDTILEASGKNTAIALQRLKKGEPPEIRMTGGEIILRDNASLARANDRAILDLQGVKVNGEMRSGRYELEKNEIR